MTILISDNGEFSKGLKFEARGSAHSLSHGPVYGSAGYLALRLDANGVDTNVYLQASTDGVNWYDQSHNIDLTLSQISGITYINNRYVVYGLENVGNLYTTYKIRINTSTDGITWTSYTSAAAVGMVTVQQLTYSNSLWQVFGTGSSGGVPFLVSYSSSNLTTWTQRINYQPGDGATYSWNQLGFTDVATDGTNTVAIAWLKSFRDSDGGEIGYDPIYLVSSNGTNWGGTGGFGSAQTFRGTGVSGLSPAGWKTSGIAHASGTWIAVGTTGKIYTSTNRTTWTARTSGTSVDLYSVGIGNGKYVINANGIILTSSNLTTWTSTTPTTVQSDDILAYSNGVLNSSLSKPVYANSKWIFSDYTSTDDAVTWSIIDYQLPNKQPFIKYPYEAGWNTWKTMDFWVYIPSRPTPYTQFGIASERGAWTVYIESSSSVSRIRYAGAGFTAFPSATLATGTYGQWNHFRLLVDGGSASWYLNGTRSSTTVVNERATGSDTLNIGFSAYLGENQRARNVDYFLDEYLLTDEALNSPSATTITVPTVPWRNNEYTSILLHYDTNFEDDPSTPTRNASLNVNATFTEVAVAAKNVKTSVALSSTLSQTVTATKAVNASVSLTTTSIITASITRTKQFAASLTVSASNLTANARSRGFGAILTSAVTVDAVVTKTLGVITSSLTSTSSLIAGLIKVKQFSASLTSSGSTLIANVRGRTSDIALVVTSTLTADAVRTRRLAGTLTTNSSLSAQPNRIKQFSASLDVGAIELVVNQKTSRLIAALTTTSTLTASAGRIRRASASLNCQASVTAIGSQSRIMRANLSVTSSLFATTGNVKRAVANLNAGAFQVSTGRVINLANSDTWIIPSDNRFWIIQNESRLWTIADEDREYTIKG